MILWSFLMLLPKVTVGDTPDRRRRPRVRLAYPVRLIQPGLDVRVETKTEDLSCEGFFCISERVFSPHETLECELVIPGGKPSQPAPERDMVLRCRAEVVRVEPQSRSGAFGVACRFADYTIEGSQSGRTIFGLL
jgi:PilZ domain